MAPTVAKKPEAVEPIAPRPAIVKRDPPVQKAEVKPEVKSAASPPPPPAKQSSKSNANATVVKAIPAKAVPAVAAVAAVTPSLSPVYEERGPSVSYEVRLLDANGRIPRRLSP